VTVYHGTVSSQSTYELGAADRHGGAAYTRSGVGVERYVDVASGGVAVVAYTFPRSTTTDQQDGWSTTDQQDGWTTIDQQDGWTTMDQQDG